MIFNLQAPLNVGFSAALNTSNRIVTILSVPAVYATAFGFMVGPEKLKNILDRIFFSVFSISQLEPNLYIFI
jgi:hypothetical protein